MSDSQQQHAPPPTRQAVLIAHMEQFCLRTGTSNDRWSELVDRVYCERVSVDQRSLPAPDLVRVTDAEAWQKLRRAWNTTLRRYVANAMRFPAELEEAWVFALAEPYRTECIRELAARCGLYGAVRRADGQVGDGTSWAAVLEDHARLTRGMARILADGRIDDRDVHALPELIADIERMQADLESLRRRAQRTLNAPGLRGVQ